MRSLVILLFVWSGLIVIGAIRSNSPSGYSGEIVGVDHVEDYSSDNMKLFPNPNNGHFSIEFANPLKIQKCEIVISDLIGKQIFHDQLLRDELSKDFDLHDLKSGIYIMVIRDKDILVTRKFIKK